MITRRIEKHIINKTNNYYNMLYDFCVKSKNLYNFANYQIRQEFFKNNKYLNYYKLDKLLKLLSDNNQKYPYKEMPTATSAQQCLRILDKNWQSFFKEIKDWSKNKSKYLGKPKLPKYIKQNKLNSIILPHNVCKIKDNYIVFPKTFLGFKLKTTLQNIKEIRIIPKNNHFIVEAVYNKKIRDLKEDNLRYISIDLGINNLMALSNNCNQIFEIINGKKK